MSADERQRLLGAATAAIPTYDGIEENVPEEVDSMTGMTVTEPAGQNYRKLPQYVAALSAAGGALAAGTVLGWTSPTQLALVDNQEYGFEISREAFSWISSAMTLGAAAVCIPIGLLINLIGRKPTMLMLVLPFTIGWTLIIWATSVPMMLIGRVLVGISGGAFCVTAPMYTGEIASKEIRGILGSFFQLMVTIGILFVYAVGHGVNVFTLSIICAVIPIVFGLIFFFMPESPLYLVTKDRTSRATDAIKWLRGDKYDHSAELADLQQQIDEIRSHPVSLAAAMRRRATVRALVISMGLMFFQQTCGINAVIFYTTDIFEAANTGIEAGVATIIVGVMQVVATFLATLMVDRLGRRVLLITSDCAMATCTLLLGVYFFLKDQDAERVANLGWLPIVSLCVFIVMFSIGFGPIPFIIIGELFASDIKGVAGGVAMTINWTLAFVITKAFPSLLDAIGSGPTFWIFSGLSFLGTVFLVFYLPETKGKSLAEIQFLLNGQRSSSAQSIAPKQDDSLIEK
ncbi:facilitated trehalose transporter Tret1 isoform X2 [Phlebotomus argentipes]|uniref:facilitated trehalose transporter Tret1 isoform X2 n=1 Tax=Phlebotomus argentipes TaxID=94469 RepID=UPI002892E5B1|nr:facilitated trehalose transporter Tret1 isoform X2 [Phlebotomus argentipes]